jgi:Family of unknown function (DUF6788)
MPDTPADLRRRQILDEIASLGYCLPGSVVDRTSRCGNPNCRCHTDPDHRHGPYRSWTRKVAGKTVTRNLSDDQLQRYQPWFDNDRRLKALVSELEELSITEFDHAERQHPKS